VVRLRLWIATQTSRFKAVVSSVGWSDWISQALLGQNSVYASYQERYPFVGQVGRYAQEQGDFPLGDNVTPWSDPAAYWRNSPVVLAAQVTAPILLIHSDLDAYPLTQDEEMFTALNLLHKPAGFITYWGEGHILSSPANLRQEWASVLAWYDKYLKPDTSVGGEGKARLH
jgi:dipeptidyl aminopeptidase/acylaminoacyl peptidase